MEPTVTLTLTTTQFVSILVCLEGDLLQAKYFRREPSHYQVAITDAAALLRQMHATLGL